MQNYDPASRPPSAPSGVAEITDQIPKTEADPTGQFVRGYRVYFRTAGGQTGSVFVSEAQYTVANVIAAVADIAGRMGQIQGARV